MTNLKILTRLTASFALVMALGAAGVADAAPKTSPKATKSRVTKTRSKARRSVKKVPARRTKKLPREWVWKRKVVRLDGMFAGRRR